MTATLMKRAAQICLVEKGDSRLHARRRLIHGPSVSELPQRHACLGPQRGWWRGPPRAVPAGATLLPAIG